MYLIDVTAERGNSYKINKVMINNGGFKKYEIKQTYIICIQYEFDDINIDKIYKELKEKINPYYIDLYELNKNYSYQK